MLIPTAARMNESSKVFVLAQSPEAGRVVLEDEAVPVALAEEVLTQVQADLGGDAHIPESGTSMGRPSW
eukprot:6318175-Alexandrium_andersonii.AAC.1